MSEETLKKLPALKWTQLPRATGNLRKVGDDDKYLSGTQLCLCVLNRASGVATIQADVSTCGSWGLSLHLLPSAFSFISFVVAMCVFKLSNFFCLTLCLYLVEMWAVVCYFFLAYFYMIVKNFFFNFSLAVLRLLNQTFWSLFQGMTLQQKERKIIGIIFLKEKKASVKST